MSVDDEDDDNPFAAMLREEEDDDEEKMLADLEMLAASEEEDEVEEAKRSAEVPVGEDAAITEKEVSPEPTTPTLAKPLPRNRRSKGRSLSGRLRSPKVKFGEDDEQISPSASASPGRTPDTSPTAENCAAPAATSARKMSGRLGSASAVQFGKSDASAAQFGKSDEEIDRGTVTSPEAAPDSSPPEENAAPAASSPRRKMRGRLSMSRSVSRVRFGNDEDSNDSPDPSDACPRPLPSPEEKSVPVTLDDVAVATAAAAAANATRAAAPVRRARRFSLTRSSSKKPEAVNTESTAAAASVDVPAMSAPRRTRRFSLTRSSSKAAAPSAESTSATSSDVQATSSAPIRSRRRSLTRGLMRTMSSKSTRKLTVDDDDSASQTTPAFMPEAPKPRGKSVSKKGNRRGMFQRSQTIVGLSSPVARDSDDDEPGTSAAQETCSTADSPRTRLSRSNTVANITDGAITFASSQTSSKPQQGGRRTRERRTSLGNLPKLELSELAKEVAVEDKTPSVSSGAQEGKPKDGTKEGTKKPVRRRRRYSLSDMDDTSAPRPDKDSWEKREKEMNRQGYLCKLSDGVGGVMKKWTKRWFTLNDGVLRIYKNHRYDEGEERKIVNIDDMLQMNDSATPRANADREVKKQELGDFDFDIDLGEKVLHLRAENAEEKKAWMYALQVCH